MAGQAEVEILRADRMPLPCPPTARLCREGKHCTNFAKRNAVASGALSAGRQAVYGIASGPMQGITRPLRPSLSFCRRTGHLADHPAWAMLRLPTSGGSQRDLGVNQENHDT